MAVILAVLAFLTTVTFVFALIYLVGRAGNVHNRLQKVLIDDGFSFAEEITEEGEKKRRPTLLQRVGKVFSRNSSRALEDLLRQADVPLKGGEFLALSFFLAAGLAGFGFLLGPLFGLLGLAAGAVGPRIYLRLKIKRRLAKFERQIGDSLVMMANALKAGYSFLQAMDMVATEMEDPIAKEFSVCLKEVNLGVNTERALQAMSRRVGSDDFDLVITAVLIQRQVGGNLSEILETIAETIRERVRIKGEIKTLTAQGRISGVVIALLPIGLGLFLAVVNPDYMQLLFSHPLGLVMVVGAGVSQLIGGLIIRKIIQIEV